MKKVGNRIAFGSGLHDWLVYDAGGDTCLGIVTRCANIAGPFFFVASGNPWIKFETLQEAVAACRP